MTKIQMSEHPSFSRSRDVLKILLICLAAHWMLLINDGFFWDDNLFYTLLDGSHYDELKTWMLEMGLPLNYVFFRVYHLFFDSSAHRIVSFIVILASAVCLYSLFLHFGGLFQSLALIFAIFYITFLPFRSAVLFSTLHYQATLLLFLLAVLVRARYGAHEVLHVRLSALAVFLVLAFLSFNTASILVLYCFYCLFDYFFGHQFGRKAWRLRSVADYVAGNLHVLLLPFAYWIGKSMLFPTHGLYEGYNNIEFDPMDMLRAAKDFVAGMTRAGPVHNVATQTPSAILLVGGVFMFMIAAPRVFDRFQLPILSVAKGRFQVFVWLLAFLAISALPYIIVGAHPRFQGWESRHYLLLTISLPLSLVGGLVLYVDHVKTRLGLEAARYIGRALVVCLSLIGIISTGNVYIGYQALAVKQWAVVEVLKNRADLQKFSNFKIHDKVGDFSDSGSLGGMATRQNWYEWAAVFTKAWGEQRWYAYNVEDDEEQPPKMLRYGSLHINPDVHVGYLVLKSNTRRNQASVVGKYLRLKYFGTEAKLQEFLSGLVSLELRADFERH